MVPTASGSPYSAVVAHASDGVSLYYNPTVRKINCHTGVDNFNTTALTLGALYHVVISITAGNGTFYINGVTDGTFTGWPGRDFNSLTGLTDPASALVASLIDEIAIYDKALTPAQIANHYALRLPSDPYGQRVISDGAVLYLRLDEPSGTSVTSKVGGYTGTISGGVTLNQPGPLSDGNKAMLFDGATGYVVTTGNVTIPLITTIELWLKPVTPLPGGTHFMAFSTRGGGGNNDIYVALKPGNQIEVGTGFGSASMVGNVGDGLWHQVTCVLDNVTCRFYIDGVFVTAPVLTGRTVPIQWLASIGRDQLGTLHFPGSLDEVAIYPTALTPQQIAEHYALRYGQRTYQEFVIADGAVAYWKLDESSGTVARSTVGSYDGTISGGVTLGQPGAINGYTAMAFDGVDDRIVGGQLTIGSSAFSIESWFKTSVGSGEQAIFSHRDSASGVLVSIKNGQLQLYKNPEGAFLVPQNVANGQWHHVVATNNGTTTNVYVDGVLGVSNSMAGQAITSAWYISYDPFILGYVTGLLDEVAIYNTALTPQQIAAHYQARIAWPDTPYAPSVPADVYPAGSLSNRWLPLTPSDVIDAPFGKLWIGGAGTLAAVGADGRIVNFTGVRAGTMLPLAGRRINATNTTATAILALRTQ